MTAAARSAASLRGSRGPIWIAASSSKRWLLREAPRSQREALAECMHGAKERSQGEALAECLRSQREALAPRWHQRGALRAMCTPFLYMVLVGFERQLPIGDLQLT